MVNRRIQVTKDDSEYSLDGVHRLAGFEQVVFASRRVQNHVGNLSYGHNDVCELLKSLRAEHFCHSECYEDDRRWHDVYFLPHPVDVNPDERLYIKFRVTPDCVLIELCSFHPEGWE